MLVKVKSFANFDWDDADAVRNAIINIDNRTKENKALTYQVDDNNSMRVAVGDIVIVPIKQYRGDDEITKLGVVTAIDNDTDVASLPYKVKNVIAKLAIAKQLVSQRQLTKQVKAFRIAKERAALIDKINNFKQLAASDAQMQALINEINVDEMDNDELRQFINNVDLD